MLRTGLRIPRTAGRTLGLSLGARASVSGRRHIHHVPTLPHDYTQGVPNLMSPAGFSLAWTEYMTLMTEKLNALTAGTELEDKDTKTIALMTAREPNQAPIFNYASMAHNNHFFFSGISPTGTAMPEALEKELTANFSSVETLRREFVITASSMFGPGFVWLVKAGISDYRLLTTYLAGSPYPGAHWRAQPTDMNTVGTRGTASRYFGNQGKFGSGRAGPNLPPGGIEVEPLLCLNTWEHTWLLDWGVGAGGSGGKAAFAEAWWDLIDWEKVATKSGVMRPAFLGASAAA
jgi:Fe-Mn family superoxide dismutase